MLAARVLPAVVAAVLLTVGSRAGAEQGIYARPPSPNWGQATTPRWPDRATSGADQRATPAPARYRPWSAVSGDPVSVPPPSRNALGQRTWNTLLGGAAEPLPQPTEPRRTPAPPALTAGPGYGTAGTYGGGLYGGYGVPLDHLDSYGSPYLFGLSGNGLGYGNSSLLGLGGLTPWAWPW